MRGVPAIARTRRTSICGRNMRPPRSKRGQKSVTSTAEPFELKRRVTSTAVLPRYSCSLRSNPASSMAHAPRPVAAPSSTRAWNTGSPSRRGRQLHTTRASRSISAEMMQFPVTPRSSEAVRVMAPPSFRAP